MNQNMIANAPSKGNVGADKTRVSVPQLTRVANNGQTAAADCSGGDGMRIDQGVRQTVTVDYFDALASGRFAGNSY